MIDKYALALLAMLIATQICHGVTQCAQQLTVPHIWQEFAPYCPGG
jgi:hypothetical protein